MEDRWPFNYRRGIRWCRHVEKAIHLYAPTPFDQGAMAGILNAIEYQFDEEARPETIRLLIAALLQHATSCGLAAADLGIQDTAEAVFKDLRPEKPSGTR